MEAAESPGLSAWELALRPIPTNEMLPCGQREKRRPKAPAFGLGIGLAANSNE